MEELIKHKLKLDSEFLAKAVVKLMKQSIFERFVKTKELSEEDQEFCDKIDWYPIDELEVKEEYAEKLKRVSEGEHLPMTVEGLDKLMHIK